MSELADNIAATVRSWYEEHREHWTARIGQSGTPDEFMLALVAEVERVVKELTPVPHVSPPPPPPPVPFHLPEPHDRGAKTPKAHKKTGKK
jgi:hypothetical protein